MIHIQVNEDAEQLWESLGVSFDALEEAAKEALYQTRAAGDVELTIVLGMDELLHDMNEEFLEIDASPTCSLSAPTSPTPTPRRITWATSSSRSRAPWRRLPRLRTPSKTSCTCWWCTACCT